MNIKTRDVLHIDELGAFPGNERTGSGTRVQHERPEPYLQSRCEALKNHILTLNKTCKKGIAICKVFLVHEIQSIKGVNNH